MSDDWLKKADELRKQNHPDNADESTTPVVDRDTFRAHNFRKVDAMLRTLGEAWKAEDPNQPGMLIIGHHPGHDYRIDVAHGYWADFFLYDKNNLAEKWTSNLVASLWVEFHAGYFEINLPDDLDGYPKQVTTLDDLKAVLAELWANGNIQVSQPQ